MKANTILVVPGLREDAPAHWQSLLAARLKSVRVLPALGRRNIDLAARTAAIEAAVASIAGPTVIVAHSGGAIATAHWALRTRLRNVRGALLATPPVFHCPLPPEFPGLPEFEHAGWTPVPRAPLPFRSIVAASRNDPLGPFDLVAELASSWQAELVDLGEAGHLNPASGYGEWPLASELISRLDGYDHRAPIEPATTQQT